MQKQTWRRHANETSWIETRSLALSFLAVEAKWAVLHNYVIVKPSV